MKGFEIWGGLRLKRTRVGINHKLLRGNVCVPLEREIMKCLVNWDGLKLNPPRVDINNKSPWGNVCVPGKPSVHR